jgi:uncharacterized protein YggE
MTQSYQPYEAKELQPMQARSILILSLALVLIFSLSAWAMNSNAATDEEPGLIHVTGEAEVRVPPDEVILTLGMETWDHNLQIAKIQNDERVKAVLALAQAHGVEPRYIQTDHISIEPRYEDYYERQKLLGYVVRNTVVITLKDISKFDALLTDVLESGANYVHGINFRTTELRKYRDEARALAIRAAKEKAVALAGELDQEVGRPRSINEDQVGWWSWYNRWWGARGGGMMTQNVIQEVPAGGAPVDGETISPGQIMVTAKVNVSFELE